ncbi:P-loop containing nucleoside triphosphate hydrolase protein [Aspergillus filifer]
MDEQMKTDLVKDMEEFLDESTQRWYVARGFPYRRGYLLIGPPGTGKSSFTFSIAGRFDLDIYTLNLSGVGDKTLMKLFADLPPHCIILLEDVDAAGMGRRDDSDAGQTTNPASGVTLSGLLNVLDGVSSQEGRVLIMTTNHIEHLDDALIRPGRIDRKVYFELVDRDVTARLFRTVFSQMPDAHKHATEDIDDENMEGLAIKFAAKVPEKIFSPAEILSYLLERKKSPVRAVSEVEDWVRNASEQDQRKKPLPNATADKLESAVSDWSAPAIFPSEPPPTPVGFPGPPTPPLDTDELEKQLAKAADREDSSQIPEKSVTTSWLIEDGFEHKSRSTNNQKQAQTPTPEYKVVLEIWDKKTSQYKIVDSPETVEEIDYVDEHVFLVRNHVDIRSKTTTFIDVKSKVLRDALRVDLQNVRVVSLLEDKPSIEQNILFHFLPEFHDHIQKLQDDKSRDPREAQHLTLLTDYLNNAYASTSQRIASLLPHRQITYDLLWTLFKPGELVYSTCLGTGKPRCAIFDAGEQAVQDGVIYYKLECRYLDFDGWTFGEACVTLGIEKFRGAKSINSFQAFPLHHHPDHEQVRQRLVESGQKFCKLTSTHIQHCDGTAFIMKEGKPVQMNINSRVAVDAAFFREMRPNYSRPHIQDIWQKSSGMQITNLDFFFDDGRRREKEGMRQKGIKLQQMTEKNFLVCCPTVRCFSFMEKAFLECAVADLHEAVWNPGSFDCLKIPQDMKQILLSLATSRLGLTQTVPFDDIIEGKGRGINILLHGPTGVGKTFTVEATAEWFKLPLYSISAGELIVDHGDLHALEHQLDIIFRVAKHFNAVLLLDEADAFMERRTSYLDAHNRLLTVFLRKLDYYEGILFLTSNRAIDFDDAILSRIHLKVKYEDLTNESRREIWDDFLSKAQTSAGSSSIKDEERQRLESLALNGREIKNLTAIAHALATSDGKQLSYEHLEMAAKSNEKFTNEFGKPEHLESIYS